MDFFKTIPFWDFFKNKIGKLLGVLSGFCFANFFGALLGFSIGAIIDKLYQDGSFRFDLDERPRNYLQTDFIMSVLLLASSILKTDAEKDEKEFTFIKNFISDQFGNEKLEEYLSVLEHNKLKEPDLKKITQQIRVNSSYETRLQVIYFLFGLADADKIIKDKEVADIKIISIHLSISAEDFESIKALFINDLDLKYKILQVSPDATDKEVKEAYRKLVLKYHPDKKNGSNNPDSDDNFLLVKEAYEFIKNKRGFA